MTETTDLELTTTRTISAPPEAVFDAWLDPALLTRFMTPNPDMTVPSAKTDPREGGRFEIVMRAGEQDIPHGGTYQVIDRPNRLVFTWESPFSTEGSTVTLTLSPSEGGTEVTLHHIRFPSEESRDNHAGGWAAILAALDAALA
ncbi:SRPBCC domain-containing protein [Rhodophyticola sp. CCM32]|uniref:SRPBCC family protein n=1 Tax=Rhodophyticola sp. CCM32 TaxID=2916397 RepID=UPI00107FA06B|nr:SRPBCC domain-containing protein [Rhodophyticola sp. CCM32]QBX99781.1 SRPBCC domain-containing protein [Rhodophyticola sp. CCM32]